MIPLAHELFINMYRRNRQTYRQTYTGRPTDKPTQADLQTNLHRQTYRQTYTGRPTDKPTQTNLRTNLHRQTYGQTYTGRPTDKPTQADLQTNLQTNLCMYTPTSTHLQGIIICIYNCTESGTLHGRVNLHYVQSPSISSITSSSTTPTYKPVPCSYCINIVHEEMEPSTYHLSGNHAPSPPPNALSHKPKCTYISNAYTPQIHTHTHTPNAHSPKYTNTPNAHTPNAHTPNAHTPNAHTPQMHSPRC